MDEFMLINQVKEELCYISSDFLNELQNCKRKKSQRDPNHFAIDTFGGRLKKQFVLPDFHKIMKGYVKSDNSEVLAHEQILAMESERFAVPEVLFHPNDIGIDQAGIVESTWQSLQSLSQLDMGLAASNIVLTGGNINLPNLSQRFETEIRPDVPDMFAMKIYAPTQPEFYAYRGAHHFVTKELKNGTLSSSHMVSKSEYQEFGHFYCNRQFNDSW